MNNKRTAKYYRKNEKSVMRYLGFEPVEGSGSGWINKEDGENESALAQLKSTDAQQITIKLLDLQKLVEHALTAHKLPVFVLDFMQAGELWVMARASDVDFETLKEEGQEGIKINAGMPSGLSAKEINVCFSDGGSKPEIIISSKAAREEFMKKLSEKYDRGNNKK